MAQFRKPAAFGQFRPGGRLGWARGAVGAVLGIGLACLAARLLPASAGSPWIVAPVGASAVLVFAVPASPLAQPWPVAGGNLLSALTGLAVGHLIGVPWLAASVAVGVAIAVMTYSRSLHPPGGASAILGALAASPTALLTPMALNLAALLAAGWLYNNLTGHAWPHRPAPAPPQPVETWAGRYDIADLDAVLDEWDEVLDVNRRDLDLLIRAVERRVQRRTGATRH